MASTGGGAARSSKKKNPDIADQEEVSATDLVGTAGTIDSVERKIDLLVTTIAALANSVNKLVGNADVKVEEAATRDKFLEKSNASSEKKKRRMRIRCRRNQCRKLLK